MNKEDFHKYFRGEMNYAEKAEFLRFVDSNPGRKQIFEEIQNEWESNTRSLTTDWSADEVWQKIDSRISWRNNNRNILPMVYKVAAALLVIVITGYLIYTNSTIPTESTGTTPLKEFITEIGQKKTLQLPDGSRIILNSSSKLSIAPFVGTDKREMYLTGEAFFEVAKDEEKPFIVYSNGISTTALGTSFNITTLKDEVQVALATGKVLVQPMDQSSQSNQNIILKPGESARYNQSFQTLEIGNYDVKRVLSWKEGIIYFESSEFSNVRQALEEWYGVKFKIIGQPSETLNITAEFKNETLEHVLMGLSTTCDFQFDINDKTVILKFNESSD